MRKYMLNNYEESFTPGYGTLDHYIGDKGLA
jgi:hypothetical protein